MNSRNFSCCSLLLFSFCLRHRCWRRFFTWWWSLTLCGEIKYIDELLIILLWVLSVSWMHEHAHRLFYCIFNLLCHLRLNVRPEIFEGFYLCRLVIFCVLLKLIISAIRTDWHFLLGINFCHFHKVPSVQH